MRRIYKYQFEQDLYALERLETQDSSSKYCNADWDLLKEDEDEAEAEKKKAARKQKKYDWRKYKEAKKKVGDRRGKASSRT